MAPTGKIKYDAGTIDSVFLALRQKAFKEPGDEDWDCSKIRIAICTGDNKAKLIRDSLTSGIQIVDWSDEQIAEEHKKHRFSNYIGATWTKQKVDSMEEVLSKSRPSVPYEYQTILMFSKPIFDSQNEYCILIKEHSLGRVFSNSGGLYLSKKIAGTWRVIAYKYTWAN